MNKTIPERCQRSPLRCKTSISSQITPSIIVDAKKISNSIDDAMVLFDVPPKHRMEVVSLTKAIVSSPVFQKRKTHEKSIVDIANSAAFFVSISNGYLPDVERIFKTDSAIDHFREISQFVFDYILHKNKIYEESIISCECEEYFLLIYIYDIIDEYKFIDNTFFNANAYNIAHYLSQYLSIDDINEMDSVRLLSIILAIAYILAQEKNSVILKGIEYEPLYFLNDLLDGNCVDGLDSDEFESDVIEISDKLRK